MMWIEQDTGYETPCWLWQQRVGKRGYGIICRTIDGTKRWLYAHRWMYEQERGEIPKTLVIDHRCNRTDCVRPDHLEAVAPVGEPPKGQHRQAHSTGRA